MWLALSMTRQPSLWHGQWLYSHSLLKLFCGWLKRQRTRRGKGWRAGRLINENVVGQRLLTLTLLFFNKGKSVLTVILLLLFGPYAVPIGGADENELTPDLLLCFRSLPVPIPFPHSERAVNMSAQSVRGSLLTASLSANVPVHKIIHSVHSTPWPLVSVSSWSSHTRGPPPHFTRLTWQN